MATLLDGRAVSDSLLKKVANEVKSLREKSVTVKLVVIVVGEDPASAVYVKHKEKACEKTGIEGERISYPADISEEELLAKVKELNADKSVNGMIVQLPLPKHINEGKVIKSIDPRKDVDGFHACNVGKMFLSQDFEDMAPCTAKGIIEILDYYDVDVSGMDVTVVGKSNIVGKPIAVMLMNRGATVTVCHSRTKDLKGNCERADMVIVAVGRAGLITTDMVKNDAIVIDVGINRLDDGKLVGDVDYNEVEKKASLITPVPGGVGPMTVACLLANTVTATKKQNNL